MRFRAHTRRSEHGFALLMVTFTTAVSLMILAAVLQWTSTNARLTDGNNQYFTSVSAAEAATEKVLTRILSDFQGGGESRVHENLDAYRNQVPTSSEAPFWADFEFNNAMGAAGETFVDRVSSEAYVELNSQYSGLHGWASTYRILSNARQTGTPRNVTAAVNQDVQVASIPIFQFAIFYGLDLEINTMTAMTVNGRVHCNGTIFTYPSATLTFRSDVTSVGQVNKTRKPGDPAYSSRPPSGTITYKGQKDSGVASMNLPIGTNNTPSAVYAVLEIPPPNETPQSLMAEQRYYNKAELVIVVTNNAVMIGAKGPHSGSLNIIPWSDAIRIVSTNLTLTDQREGKTVRVTQIDVSQIAPWSMTNSAARSVLGGDPVNLIYVADNRTTTSSQLNAVRLVNGQTLPPRGLTVATPNPLYVQGHYNQPTSSHLGTTNTANTKPASLICDALTILSGNWKDANSGKSYTARTASSTTVNAAILTGVVETTNNPARYSGGVHNLGRFLEDWSGDVFTCNGSMVVLFPSRRATAPFQQPGAYYEPPARNFSFDLNFTDVTKLPPGTPELRAVIRNTWSLVAPNTTDVASQF